MKITRREMIKLSAAAFAASALNIPFVRPAAAQDEIEVDRWIKGTCRFCGTGCGVFVGVRNGRIVGIRGNPKAATNFGFLCVKRLQGLHKHVPP